MKEKISITLDLDILERLDIDMNKHRLKNRSQFIEFVLKQTLFNAEKRLALLERRRDILLTEFKVLNEDILKMQEHCENLKKAKESEAALNQKTTI